MMTKEEATKLLGKIAGYLEIVQKDPHSTSFVPLSDAYCSLGMLEEALSVARQGIEALPFFGPGYVVLGRAQMQYGELDNAERSFQKALDIDPQSVAALKNMAKLYVFRGEREQACGLLARAVDSTPEDPVLANLHKSLLTAANAPEPVSATASCSDTSEHTAPFATATVADLYVRQGHLEQARDIYRQLLQAQPDDVSLEQRLTHVETLLAEQPVPESAIESAAPDFVDESFHVDSRSDVVALLHRWLQAIQVRREHVQKHSAGHC
ncbi:tetratricopeptide repeat protein [Syntrophotalea carbinolica]|nr:tetratricopeptide repeat protein [Syntrophotalea carbinolica]